MSLRMMLSVHLAAVILCLVTIRLALGSCPDVARADWGARAPRDRTNLSLPAAHVVIHHTYLPPACADAASCAAAMRSMQDMHQLRNGWSDIGYNFCVGGDGLVYEGRGWDIVGAHAPKYNFISVGICFIGDFRTSTPSPAMLSAAQTLIACGVARGSILAAYKLVGHSQVRNTECPGGALLAEIQTWPRWSSLRDVQPRPAPIATATPSSRNDAAVAGDAGTRATTSGVWSTEERTTSGGLSSDAATTEVSGTEGTTSEVSGTEGTTSEVLGTEGTTSEVSGTEGTTSEVLGTEGTTSEVSGTEGTSSEVSGTEGTTSEVSATEDTRSGDSVIELSTSVEADADASASSPSSAEVDDVVAVSEVTSEVAQNNTIDNAATSD